MQKKVIFFLALFFLSLQSCKSKKEEKKCQICRVNIVQEPQSLDPRKVRDLNSNNIVKMFFDGLMRVSADNLNYENIEYALTKSCIVSEDKKTYTFILKDSLWSNGEEITALDFEYTIKKSLKPDFIVSEVSPLFVIKNAKKAKEGLIDLSEVGIKSLDEKILEIELEKPCPYFLKLLTKPSFFAINKKMDEKDASWASSTKNYVTSGPFKLSKWLFNDVIEAEKNEYYWDKEKVNLDKISMIMVQNDVELTMFESNELDIAGSPFSILKVDSLKNSKALQTYHSKPYYGTGFLRINTEKINDIEFRKAFFKAIDREKIVQNVLQGDQKPAFNFVPNDKKDLEKIENKDFEKKTIKLSYQKVGRTHALAQAIQSELKNNLNLDVELIAYETMSYYHMLNNLDYEVALSSWIADMDPIDFLNVFKYKNSSTNNTGWENQKYINLLDQSEDILDLQKREKVLKKAEKILLDEAAIVPIFHLTQNYLLSPKLKDVYIYPSGFIDFKYAYFE